MLILPMLVVLGTFLGHRNMLQTNKPHILVFETMTFWSFLKDPNLEKNECSKLTFQYLNLVFDT